MIKKIAVYDLDGTIVCSAHRYRIKNGSIDLDHWRNNSIAEKIAMDGLLPIADNYKKDILRKNTLVVIATARVCKPGDPSYQFVAYHLGMPDVFIHRLYDNDTRKGAALKLEHLKPVINWYPTAKITVYEDNVQYLKHLCDELGALGIYVPSVQGY